MTVEAFMRAVRNNWENGNNVYLRGFGSFVVKTRAAKTGATSSRRIHRDPRPQHPFIQAKPRFLGQREGQREGWRTSAWRFPNHRGLDCRCGCIGSGTRVDAQDTRLV